MVGPLPRRTALRLGALTALAVLAGCARISAELGLRTVRLGRVTLANSVDEPVEITVEVLRDGTVVYESTHDLTPGSEKERAQVTIREWRDEPEARRWEIRAKRPGGERQSAEIDAARGDPDDCHDVSVVAGDWPEASVLVLLGDCDSQR